MRLIIYIVILFALSSCGEHNTAIDIFEQKYRAMTGEESLDGFKDRLADLNRDIECEGILYDPLTRDSLLTGYYYGQFYDWDLYFEAIYQVYCGESKWCFKNLDAFFARQRADGSIPRAFGMRDMSWTQQMFKPFVAQTALLGMRQNADIEWLRGNIENIKRYLNSWYTLYDTDGNLLCVWENCGHTGMDNQHHRVSGTFQNESVDLNCYLYKEWLSLAELAEMLGDLDGVHLYRAKAAGIATVIDKLLWDEEDGIYYDRLVESGELKKVKGVSAFSPLYVGIASEDQAKRLVEEHLANPDEYWDNYGVRSLSKSEKGYDQNGCTPPEAFCNWNGPTWMPFNYMFFHGLMDYGYTEYAEELAYKCLDLVYLKNPVTREYYNSTTGEGYGRNPFFGWSSLGYIMPIEFEMGGYTPSDIEEREMIPIVKDMLDGYTPQLTTQEDAEIVLNLANSDVDRGIRYTYDQRRNIYANIYVNNEKNHYIFTPLSSKAKIKITNVELVGCDETIKWSRDNDGLKVSCPKGQINELQYKITIL
ncbi:MAG: trehalase family glycosidase [Rikenellaceae bacterium]